MPHIRFARSAAVAFALAFAGSSGAQLNRYPTMEMASAMLLGGQSVQQELRLGANQKSTIMAAFNSYADIAERLVNAYKKDRSKLKPYNDQLKAAQRKLITTCLTALSPGQTKRLKEIGLNHYGIFCVTNPDVAQELKMSWRQSYEAKKYYMTFWNTMDTVSKARAAQIRAVPQPTDVNDKAQVEAYKKKVQELVRLSREIDNKKVMAVQKDMEGKTQALLTPVQLAKFNAIKGRPFKAN